MQLLTNERTAAADCSPAWTWHVGLTSVDSRQYTRRCTRASLAKAGWDETSVITHIDHHRRGPYPSFINLLRLLADQCDGEGPHSPHWILICQDDIELSAGLRWRLEASGLPYGVVSLFTAAGNHRADLSGWNQVKTPQRAWGAQALIFTPWLARRFVEDPPNVDWTRKVDHCVGLFGRRENVPLWCHSPSFVRHVGKGESTLCDPRGETAGREEDRDCAEWCRDVEELR